MFLLYLSIPYARADLNSFLKKAEPAYKWEKLSESAFSGGKEIEIHLVSQTWQGKNWEHRLQIFLPDKPKYPHFCALLNTGGNGGASEKLIGANLMKSIDSPFAILYNIPNQPLYDGRTEDALIVYTWQKYLETGDESWPLHFPMAKAVIKAMDAVQAYSKGSGIPEINEFLITGASKRGWTTWLAGASRDKRIKAIAPMVIDTLNLPKQMAHQAEAYGGFSEQIVDYTKAGIMGALDTARGKRLIELEDPYSYRKIITLPKLLILGTNDRYWAQDALNFYWNDLKGMKSVLYTPNSGHGLEDRTRVFNTLAAFARSIASKSELPKMTWKFTSAARGIDIEIESNSHPISARLFRAAAKTQDFRNSKWTSEEVAPGVGSFAAHMEAPKDGYAASFVETTFEQDGKLFTLSTQLQILKAQ